MDAASQPVISYCRMLVRPGRHVVAAVGWHAHDMVAHVYVRSEDPVNAGAAGADFFDQQALEFVEYLSLPRRLSRLQISDDEFEHAQAYDIACREGVAIVMSTVLGATRG